MGFTPIFFPSDKYGLIFKRQYLVLWNILSIFCRNEIVGSNMFIKKKSTLLFISKQ